MNPEIFIELSKLLLITFTVVGITRLLKQPSLIGYIISGVVAGPFMFDMISSVETLNAFSHIGIALLLFMVGLNLNPKVIKNVGGISLISGIGQVVFTTAVGFLISRALGFSTVASLYLGIALAFSSTIVIMKLISDKKDLESLYGRISIGFLIVQDFIAIFILLVISAISKGDNIVELLIDTFFIGFGSIIALFLVAKYVLPKALEKVAKSQEFLLLFSITWCFVIASAFHYINLSIEAGALLAGIALSMSPYHFEISSRMRTLRDFFLILFFIILGSQMVFSNILANMSLIIILSLFVIIGNPIIVMILMGFFGYTKRTGFLAGLTVAQISEFSLVLISMAVGVGHVDNEILSIVTAVGLITFAVSTYMIMYSDQLYSYCSKYLGIFERKVKKIDTHKKNSSHDILLFGYNRIGFDILKSLKKIKKQFLIIDYDPEVIQELSIKGFDCKYGDANDSELLDEINFADAKMVISTIPIIDTNLLLIKKAKDANKDVIVSVVSHNIDDATRLYDEGATYVIMPHFLGGKHFSTMIETNKLSMEKFLEHRIEHIEHLNERKESGHKHPTHESR